VNHALLAFRRKRVGTNTLRCNAGACWTWGMDMPDLPVIETGDTHKMARKSVQRPRVELRDGLGRKGSRGDSAVSSALTGRSLSAEVGYAASAVTTSSREGHQCVQLMSFGSPGDDALEDVGGPRHRIDAVQLRRLDQRHRYRPMAGPGIAACEQRILAQQSVRPDASPGQSKAARLLLITDFFEIARRRPLMDHCAGGPAAPTMRDQSAPCSSGIA
jgi:hypothetical protein